MLCASDAVKQFVERIDVEHYYLDQQAARDVSPGAHFNIIDPKGWKIDILVSRDRPFSHLELERRVRADILGLSTWVATAEDTILTKLERAKDRDSVQHEDAANIIRALGDTLDNAYLDLWSTELDVKNLLDAARREARAR